MRAKKSLTAMWDTMDGDFDVKGKNVLLAWTI